MLWMLCTGLLFPLNAKSQTATAEKPEAPLPLVLLITPTDPSASDDELFLAIQAQLSAAPLDLKRHRIPASASSMPPDNQASGQIVAVTGASMLFWVTGATEDECETVYFLPEGSDGTFVRRTLALQAGTESSRFEYIALAVAGMVEKFLVTRRLVPPPPKEPPPESTKPVAPKRKWSKIQLLAAYSGILMGKNDAQHGISAGLHWVPTPRMVIGMSYTPFFEYRNENDDLRLSITSRIAEVSIAVRMAEGPIDIQAGLAYDIDLRSFSTNAVSDTFQEEHNGVSVISALNPFLLATWAFSRYVGVYARIGVAVALNETTYQTSYDDVDSDMFSPLIFKLNWNFGAIIIF